MPKRRESRLYKRGGRYWGDFRDYGDVGGRRERLVASGQSFATTDRDVARKLVTDRIKDFEQRRRNKSLLGIEREATLHEFAAEHLVKKAQLGKHTDQWLETVEMHLRAASNFFGAGRLLGSIGVKDVERYVIHLKSLPNGRGGSLSDSSIRKYLNSLSNMYRRAAGAECVPPGFNPVGGLQEKPQDSANEAEWLEVHEAALYLESARTYEHTKGRRAVPFMYPIVATLLLTGGRWSEVRGLAVEDVRFDRKTVTFRPHPWRRLKTKNAHRTVPLWPQLRSILREHLFSRSEASGGLLFPSPRSGEMIGDIRKPLDKIAKRAGWANGEIRTKGFRHTYTAARLQTVDRGAPVALYTVSRELGHTSTRMVERVYSHLGDVRHRSEVVEYRVEQYEDTLAERLIALQVAN